MGRYFKNFVLQIAVEVEDDYPDGIVQAEEEEEEQLEPEAFSGGAQAVFRSRERVPRMTAFRGSVDSASQPSSGKKRKLDGSAISGKQISWAPQVSRDIIAFKCSFSYSSVYNMSGCEIIGALLQCTVEINFL